MTIRTHLATKTTTDGTQVALWTSGTALTTGFVVYIKAHEPATADQQIWAYHVSRSDTDNSVVSAQIHAQSGDVGGGAWSVEIVEGTDALDVLIQGEVAKTINWAASVVEYD